MKHRQTDWQRGRVTIGGVFLAVALLAVGCKPAADPAPFVPKKIDPEAGFARVLEQLKENFQGFDNISLNAGTEGGRRVKFSYVVEEVSGQIIAPEDPESGGFTAQVRVRTSTSYTPLASFVAPESTTPAAEDEPAAERRPVATGLDNAEAADRRAAKRANQRVEEQIQERVRIATDESLEKLGGESMKVFDFAFENGRWVLTSEDIQESDRFVIENALTFQ